MDARIESRNGKRAVGARTKALVAEPADVFQKLELGMRRELLGLDDARRALCPRGADPDICVRLASVRTYPPFVPNPDYAPLRTPMSMLWKPEKPRDLGRIVPDRRVYKDLLTDERALLTLTETCVPFVSVDSRNTFEMLADYMPYVRRYEQCGGEAVQHAYCGHSQRTYRIEYAFGLGLEGISTKHVEDCFWRDLPATEAYFANNVKPLLGVYELSSREMGAGGSKLEEIYVDSAERNGLRLRFGMR